MAARPCVLDPETPARLWRKLVDAIETSAIKSESGQVNPPLHPTGFHAMLWRFDFSAPVDACAALDFLVAGLWKFQTHLARSAPATDCERISYHAPSHTIYRLTMQLTTGRTATRSSERFQNWNLTRAATVVPSPPFR
jgi:hypothetical protein